MMFFKMWIQMSWSNFGWKIILMCTILCNKNFLSLMTPLRKVCHATYIYCINSSHFLSSLLPLLLNLFLHAVSPVIHSFISVSLPIFNSNFLLILFFCLATCLSWIISRNLVAQSNTFQFLPLVSYASPKYYVHNIQETKHRLGMICVCSWRDLKSWSWQWLRWVR